MDGISDIVKLLKGEERQKKINNNWVTSPDVNNVNTKISSSVQLNSSHNDNIYKHQPYKNKFTNERTSLEDMYSTLFQNSSDLLLCLDSTGTIMDANKAFLNFTGLSAKDLIRKQIWKLDEILSEPHLSDYYQVFQEMLDGNPASGFYCELNDTSGIKHCMNFATYPLKNNRNGYSFLVVGSDKTKQIEPDKRFDLIVKNTSDLISVTTFSLNPVYTYINPANVHHFGYESNELLGKHCFDFIHPDDKKQLLPLLKKYISKKMNNILQRPTTEFVENIEFRFKDKHGKWHLLESTVNLIDDELLFVSKDIDEKKKIERSLKKNKDRLKQSQQIAKVGSWEWDIKNDSLWWSDELYSIFEVDKNSFSLDFNSILDYIHPEDREKNNRIVDQIIHTGKKDSFELRLLFPCGKIKWIYQVFETVKDETGQVILGKGIIQDITERKKTEIDLHEKTKRLDLALKGGDLGTWDWNIQTNKVIFDKRWAEMKGYQLDDIEPHLHSWEHLVHPDDFTEVQHILHNHLEGKTAFYEAEFRMKRKNGDWMWILDKGRVIERDETGKPLRACGTHLDITDRKKAEEDIKSLSLFPSENPNPVIRIDKDGKILYANTPGLDLLKHYRIGIGGMLQVMHHQFIKELFELGVSKQIEHTISEKTYLFSITPIQKSNYINIYGKDITERKKIEQSLRNNERKFRTIFENANDGIALLRLDGTIMDVNQKAVDIFGGDKNDLVGYTFSQLPSLSEEQMSTVIEQFSKMIHGYNQPMGLWITNKNGNQLYIEGNGSIITNENDEKRLVLIVRDKTEKKNIENEMKEYTTFLNTIMDESPFAMWISDTNGTVIKTNKSLLNILHLSEDQILGKYNVFNDVNLKEQGVMSWIEKVYQTLTPRRFVIYWDASKAGTVDFQGGSNLWIDVTMFPIVDEHKKLKNVVCQWVDITKLKKSELKLKKAHDDLKDLNTELEKKVDERTSEITQLLIQKDEFINQLGHDLKNPIGPFLSLLPVIQKKIDDPNIQELLQVLSRNADHMRNIVVNMIKLAKLNSPNMTLNKEEINLYRLCQGLIEKDYVLFQENNIQVQNNIPENILVFVDQLQFSELMDNLINNAVKYTEGNGTILFTATQMKDQTMISVTDTGIGMTPEQIEKIFDEFYKADISRHDFDSSGLGMPICKRIIEKHGGSINVKSPGIGKGTTIDIVVPHSPGTMSEERRIIQEG